MQKTIYSVAALTPALLIAGGLKPAQAQEVPQNARTQQLHAMLQGAVCRNDWNQALRAINPLIGAPEITSESRLELIQFRYQLENWRAAKSQITNIPNCAGATTTVRELPTRRTVAARQQSQDVSVQQLYAALQGAVCRNDWNGALAVINPMLGSPDLTSDYRQQLLRFRYQLEDWRAARSVVENIPNCSGVAITPEPEQIAAVNWAG
ncbi:hypothetical protein H6G89_16645 [Oscillatoria sp. FACHB-1407]|uniref:hypothetical protein n=1 Tax=Oscillatoria sp. FACHB-1407 TaxID=2692847 RepID=UPI0016862DE9|nr:hypothetical protein [Oscillatoria sp. FACHB-1407]MBD2462670.1 hypothetical protein [Oscillatoria sp. FACHB-1407]